MTIDDLRLPAAAHLDAIGATRLLAPVVDAAGGRLHTAEPVHVHYRPGSDIVVRYRAEVTWADGRTVGETILAASRTTGHYPGALPLVADSPTGPVEASVWRWPFDPLLAGLDTAVRPPTAAALLTDIVAGPVELVVVAYRPCERAVVRVTGADGTVVYLKVVPPTELPGLVERHRLLAAAGLPVPQVLAADEQLGIAVLHALTGSTLRDRLRDGTGPWPVADRFLALRERFAAVPAASLAPARRRLDDAVLHARMLHRVLPGHATRLGRLADAFAEAARTEVRPAAVIHGDLYESQLVVDGPEIVGVLDLDGVGPGDPIDDLATLLAHLGYRRRTGEVADASLGHYAGDLRRQFAAEVGAPALDTVTAAVTVGLATGPFRHHRPGWELETVTHLAAAERLLGW